MSDQNAESFNAVHIYSSGWEFECDECAKWTHLADEPKDGAIVTCEHCNAKFEAEGD